MKPREVRRLVLFFPYHEGREEHKRIFEAALKVSSWSYLGVKTMHRGSILIGQNHRAKITVRKVRHAIAACLDAETYAIKSLLQHTDALIRKLQYWSFEQGHFSFGPTKGVVAEQTVPHGITQQPHKKKQKQQQQQH